jgi:hypothetical protein
LEIKGLHRASSSRQRKEQGKRRQKHEELQFSLLSGPAGLSN